MTAHAKIIFILVFFVFLNSYGIGSSNLDYIIAGVIFLVYIQNLKSVNRKVNYFDLLPIIFLLIWIYGFLFGLFNGASLYNAFFNFPGILLTLTYFPFKSANFKISDVFKLIFYPTLLLNIFICVVILTGRLSFSSANFIESRQYYSVGLILQVICTSFFYIKKKDVQIFGLNYNLVRFNALISLIVLVISFSKGFWLSLVASFFLISFMTFVHHLLKNKLVFNNILSLILIPFLVTFFLIYNPDIRDGLMFFFSDDALGNSLRAEQSKYLTSEFTVSGSGFGIPLKSGYLRDEFGYSFELSYYNLIHKIGIFSVFIFFSFLVSIWSSIKLIVITGPTPKSIIAISSLTFLIAAAGNPLLFSSLNAIIFSLILSQFNINDV